MNQSLKSPTSKSAELLISFYYSVNKRNGYNQDVLKIKTEPEYGASQLTA